MKKWLVFLLMLLSSTALAAETQGPLASSLEWISLWRSEEALTLPISPEPARKEIGIPALDAGSGMLCLRLQARMSFPRPAGWNNYLALEFNSVPLDARTKASTRRLLNHRDFFQSSHPNYPRVAWIEPRNGRPCVQVFFGPAGGDLDSAVLSEREEGYWYLLDVSDIPLSPDGNRLDVTNTALSSYWNGALPQDAGLVVENLEIGTISEGIAEELLAARQIRREPVENGITLRNVTVHPNGGLQIRVGEETFFLETGFSFPGENGIQYNSLECKLPSTAEAGWQPDTRQWAAEVRVDAAGTKYSVTRRVRETDRRIEIEDTVTNLTSEVVGLAVAHSLICGQYPKDVWLGGLNKPVLPEGVWAENPTVFASLSTRGLGAVPEDDAMRLQMGAQLIENSIEFGTRRLGLAPGESYTLRLALYPCGTDHFEFINKIRDDWKTNFTVDGPFDFFDVRILTTEEGRAKAKDQILRKKMRIFSLTPWFEYYNGWMWSREDYKKLMQQAHEFVHNVVPDARCIASIETNLVPVELSFFKDSIPKKDWPIGRDAGGKYGQKATPEMTACIDASPWKDSCLRDEDGNVLLDCWYVQHYVDKPALNLMVYPTLDNYRHRNMMEQIAWLLDDVGLDGVYIDQFSLAWSDDPNRYTKEKWDGRTVRLDARGNIEKKWCDLGLISSPTRREWLESVLKRGKTVVCNTNPVTFDLQALPAFRFMETQGYEPLAEGIPLQETLAKGQLGSPLGLGHSFPSGAGADFFVRTVIAHLRFGQLYYYYATDFALEDAAGEGRGGAFGPVTHMFPFTPIELHEGWLLGQERLITCLSGEYQWPHDREPHVIQFDGCGRERPADAVVKKTEKGYNVRITLKDWWETAVVE